MSCIFIYFDDLNLLNREAILLIFNVITDVVRFEDHRFIICFYYIPNYLFLTPTQPGDGKVNLALMGHLSQAGENHRPPGSNTGEEGGIWVLYT